MLLSQLSLLAAVLEDAAILGEACGVLEDAAILGEACGVAITGAGYCTGRGGQSRRPPHPRQYRCAIRLLRDSPWAKMATVLLLAAAAAAAAAAAGACTAS